MNTPENTLYIRMGGEATLQKLVTLFYDKVAKHPDLAPIFPDDLTLTAEKQYKFLSQFFGGPPLYSQEYGHPMLRARHLPFEITPTRAKAWLACMHETLDQMELDKQVKDEMLSRFTTTAYHMMNTPE
ncbi:globin [Bacillus horti]|nr:globin [Bacillus horti]